MTTKKQIIDIGSNSIKFLITEGEEILNKGKVDIGFYNMMSNHSPSKHIITHIIVVIKDIIKNNLAFKPDETIIYATETMRQFEGQEDCINQIKSFLGLDLRILSPEEESMFSYSVVSKSYPEDQENLIVVDMGGASTEISLGSRGKYQQGVSLRVGTSNTSKIGLLKLESKAQLNGIISQAMHLCQKPALVLTGGTVDCLYRLGVVKSDEDDCDFIRLSELKEIFLERMMELQEYRQATTSNAITILEYVLDDILTISANNVIYLCKEDLRFYFI